MSPVAGMEFSLFTSSAFNPWYTQWACGSLTPVPLADEIMKAEDTYIFVGWLTRNKGLLSIGKGASIWTCFVCSRHRFRRIGNISNSVSLYDPTCSEVGRARLGCNIE